MRWKDFLHYQQGEKIAVIILLAFILAALVLNALVSHKKSNQVVLAHNETLILEFEKFRQELKEKENIESESRPAAGNTDNNRLESSPASNYQTESPGKSSFARTEKLNPGETISLNETDTAQWKKIPGIGSAFAARIVKYGRSMGGYVSKEQLREVYGIDNDLFTQISGYIDEDQNFNRLLINKLEFQSLLSHSYLNYKQVQAIVNLRKKKGKIDSLRELAILDEFTSDDIARLQPYLDFQ